MKEKIRQESKKVFVICVGDILAFFISCFCSIGWHYRNTICNLEEMLAAQANKPSTTKGGWTPGILDGQNNGCALFFFELFRRREENVTQEGTKGEASCDYFILWTQLVTCGFVEQAALELNIEGTEQKATVMGWMNFVKSINQSVSLMGSLDPPIGETQTHVHGTVTASHF